MILFQTFKQIPQSVTLTSTNGLEIRKFHITVPTFGFIELIKDLCVFSWGILFSHPADFTPVCTTELARVAELDSEFTKRNVKPIALSIDTTESHLKWISDIQAYGKTSCNCKFPFPIIDDANGILATKFNMLDRDEINSFGTTLTCRAVFIIDSNHKLRASFCYPASTGRNFV